MANLYLDYYLEQAGEKANRKRNFNIRRKVLQHGAGVGGVFSSVYRYLKPFIASGLDILKDETIKTASDVLNGVINQKPMNEVLTDRGVEIVDKMRNTAVKKLKSMTGGCIEKPLKRKRKRGSNQLTIRNNQERTLSNKTKRRRKPIEDIFK